MKPIRKVFAATTKAADEGRALIVTISTPTPDRAGDIVEPKGGDLSHFKRNPVVLFGHNYNDLPIAKAEDLQVTDEGIVARVVFPTQGTYERADAVYGLAKQGMLNAWSIGFSAKHDDTEEIDGGGLRFKSWELLEFSAVPVPANPEALTILRSKGIGDEVIEEVAPEKDEQEIEEEIKASKSNNQARRIKTITHSETDDSIEVVYDDGSADILTATDWEKIRPKDERSTRLKEGRVLSGQTRKQIGDALTQMKSAMEALEALMSASETAKDEEPANEDKCSPQPDHHMVLTYEQALKAADKVIGVALRNAKRPNPAT